MWLRFRWFGGGLEMLRVDLGLFRLGLGWFRWFMVGLGLLRGRFRVGLGLV